MGHYCFCGLRYVSHNLMIQGLLVELWARWLFSGTERGNLIRLCQGMKNFGHLWATWSLPDSPMLASSNSRPLEQCYAANTLMTRITYRRRLIKGLSLIRCTYELPLKVVTAT